MPTVRPQTELRRLIKRLNKIAESDDAFARSLALHLEGFVSENDVEPKWVSQLRSLDHRAYARAHGIEALRSLLDEFKSDELKDYVKENHIVVGGTSKLSKGDLVNRIIVAAKAA